MEADVRGRRRRRDDGRDEVPRRLRARRVDGDVEAPIRSRNASELGAVLVVEPRAVPELDEHLVAAELLPRPREVVERGLLVDDVLRQLEEDPAELARAPQRLERLEEARGTPRRAARAAAGRRGRARPPASRARRSSGITSTLDRMPRHQPERLHVHREPGRRPLGPAGDHRLGRQPVVGRVDLDRVEVLRVPGEPLLRRQLRRVEPLRERVVRPRARADPHGRRHAADRTDARRPQRRSRGSVSVIRPISIARRRPTFRRGRCRRARSRRRMTTSRRPRGSRDAPDESRIVTTPALRADRRAAERDRDAAARERHVGRRAGPFPRVRCSARRPCGAPNVSCGPPASRAARLTRGPASSVVRPGQRDARRPRRRHAGIARQRSRPTGRARARPGAARDPVLHAVEVADEPAVASPR